MAGDGVEPGTVPLVSIVIPSYNGARWIREAVRSALDQTLSDIEVIVCDDASTDGTIETLADIPDSRLRLVRNASNLGLARNWNRSLRLARGAYLKPLMQDDLLDPRCVGVLVNALQSAPMATLALCNRRLLLESRGPEIDAWATRHDNLLGRLGLPLGEVAGSDIFDVHRSRGLRDNLLGEPTSVMLRRDVLTIPGPFNPRMQQFVDLELWLRLAARGNVILVGDDLATFRVHRGSATWKPTSATAILRERLELLEGLRRDHASRALWSRVTWPHAMCWALLAAIRRVLPIPPPRSWGA